MTIPQELKATLWPQPRPITPFRLIDGHGGRFDESSLRNTWTLLFFGYTHCPDICPTTLATLQQAVPFLSGDLDLERNLQIVFVSVDPERDTKRRLASYVGYFSDRFVAATGEHAAIRNLSRQLSVMYVREESTGPAGYLISHTSSIMVIDPAGRLYARLSPPHYPPEIARRMRLVRDYYERGAR